MDSLNENFFLGFSNHMEKESGSYGKKGKSEKKAAAAGVASKVLGAMAKRPITTGVVSAAAGAGAATGVAEVKKQKEQEERRRQRIRQLLMRRLQASGYYG